MLLWIAALVTLYTGYDYFRAGAQAHHGRVTMTKLIYFAWVRERIGKPEEDRRAAGKRRDRRRPAALAEGARRGI